MLFGLRTATIARQRPNPTRASRAIGRTKAAPTMRPPIVASRTVPACSMALSMMPGSSGSSIGVEPGTSVRPTVRVEKLVRLVQQAGVELLLAAPVAQATFEIHVLLGDVLTRHAEAQPFAETVDSVERIVETVLGDTQREPANGVVDIVDLLQVRLSCRDVAAEIGGDAPQL